MRVNECVGCDAFPCKDVQHAGYLIPDIDIDPAKITIILISEAAPDNSSNYYYASGEPLFQQTTLLAFEDAGVEAKSIQELVDRGIYFTTAVKCAKIGYGVKADTIRACSRLLEQELALFPNVQVLLLMGDVAIKSINYIARRVGLAPVIPAGATYKIRGNAYYFQGKRVFPSYLQAGPSFFIEKSKRKMIAEDLAAAWALVK